MAKKKSKKDDDKKSKKLKKKAQDKKVAKKKEAKKKAKKKEAKKKEAKKKAAKKKSSFVPTPKPVVPVKKVASATKKIKEEDYSSNYNVKEAVVRLRALKSKAAVLSFTKGEKRITVTKAIPAALNRLV